MAKKQKVFDDITTVFQDSKTTKDNDFITIKNCISNKLKIEAKNESQIELINSIKNNQITLCSGLAGSGKTYLALGVALSLLRKEQSPYKKIYLSKSVTQIKGEDFGFLKGGLRDKLDPIMWSYFINLEKFIGAYNTEELIDKDIISFAPLLYIRGATIDNAIFILDEAQNVDFEKAKTVLTRIGDNSKFIFLGDNNQVDLKNKSLNCLPLLMDIFKDTHDIGVITMNDYDKSIRNPLINVIEEKYKLNKL